ncbi:MAG: FdtA/QdtA family cupin domain-containing protein [Kiritimatiellaeota bacterium]|nr:FdtA/QdtA family cupin domain-containing protein [Kiritimatiellota bacterium]
MSSLYKIIPFNVRHGNCGGSLVQFQQGDSEVNALPFEIGKVLVMSDIRTDDVRGNHAHHETEEILVALTGACVVEVDDGKGSRESVRLSAAGSGGVVECGSKGTDCGTLDVEGGMCSASDSQQPLVAEQSSLQGRLAASNQEDIKEAILLYPHVWRTMRDFEPNTTLMVVANIKYNEADYIRDREEFERVSKHWKTLGGSAEAEEV